MFEIEFWGVRGSLATAGAATAGVGGNTSCVEVRCGDQTVILDAGTGLRGLGQALLARRPGVATRAHLLLSHYHWDHIQGFPFFAPAYLPGHQLDVYGPVPEGADAAGGARAALEAQMRGPFFPVGLSAMRAALGFHGLRPEDQVTLGARGEGRGGEGARAGDGVRVRCAAARHPNGCLAYRIEHRGRSVVFATDTEHDAAGGALDLDLLALARDADLLIYDAQYTPAEYEGKRGWGHSTFAEGVRLAQAAGVASLALFHHDPGHDDFAVARIEAEARLRLPGTVAARERQIIDVERLPVRAPLPAVA